ncbi:restriction endonuclease subunit S [Limnoraphis robusta]|uniref:restriction endonuclease subunit S n=1 Tax=Limnoraphis robusta TaxID=1118279 RepID=UPI002B2131F8|nr:restriction endonuclease subunit S [Limnoraphis robusta]MEA5496413.1 restriction endonuclease subunit S [Limnoraphis robusta BA-68 BA1]
MMNDELMELPEGWQLARIDKLGIIITGSTPPKKKAEFFGDSLPFYKPTDLDAGYKVTQAREYLSELGASQSRVIPPLSVLVTCIGATIGKTGLTRNVCATNQQINAIIPEKNILPQWLFWIITSPQGQQLIIDNASATTLPILNKSRFSELPVPLPPLNEQKRIVAKIEALQERSQRVKAELVAIRPLLDQFRQSVLAAAFRGDLTKDWREKNPDIEPASVLLERIKIERRRRWEEAELEKMKAAGKTPKDDKWKQKYKEPEPVNSDDLPLLPDGWCWVNLEELSEIDLGKMLDRGKEQKGKLIPYLRNINVRWDYFDLDDLLTMDFENHELERFGLNKGDILVCEGGEPGRCAVWELENSEIKYQKTLHRLRPFLEFSRYWIVYHLKLDAIQGTVSDYCSGSTIKHLTKALFQKYPIRLTNLKEQKEIVNRIDKLFKIADNIEHLYQQTEIDLETLNQSILAKAFRGELVPQNPNDEPASELLERIRKERETHSKPAKQTRKKPPKTDNNNSTQLTLEGIE